MGRCASQPFDSQTQPWRSRVPGTFRPHFPYISTQSLPGPERKDLSPRPSCSDAQAGATLVTKAAREGARAHDRNRMGMPTVGSRKSMVG